MYSYQTKIGIFYIVKRAGRWHAIYQDESLGSYIYPQQAADDLAGGHTFLISSGVDTATLGMPEDISEWSLRNS